MKSKEKTTKYKNIKNILKKIIKKATIILSIIVMNTFTFIGTSGAVNVKKIEQLSEFVKGYSSGEELDIRENKEGSFNILKNDIPFLSQSQYVLPLQASPSTVLHKR